MRILACYFVKESMGIDLQTSMTVLLLFQTTDVPMSVQNSKTREYLHVKLHVNKNIRRECDTGFCKRYAGKRWKDALNW